MTDDAFRKIALSMPFAEEGSHMGHADFRIRNKIFASLPPESKHFPGERLGMVKLTPGQQAEFTSRGGKDRAFVPVPGGWGAKGATFVLLRSAKAAEVRAAMRLAWETVAPRDAKSA